MSDSNDLRKTSAESAEKVRTAETERPAVEPAPKPTKTVWPTVHGGWGHAQ
jgi:hypothetical protein